MKKTLETEDEKIQKICNLLKIETIEPAQKEAEKIIAAANQRAEQIILDAERQKEKLIEEAKRTIEQKHNVFQSSLEQAAKQSLESLRQSIEGQLFNTEMNRLVTNHTSNPNVIAELIQALIKAIEKDGLAVDLSVFIPNSVSTKEVNQLLGTTILSKLQDNSVALGDFSGGVKVKLNDKQLTLVITDSEIATLLSKYVRKDFRKLLFAKSQHD
ncbi:MAG: V-type ATP synthase subunit E [Parachlamydiaceae bacterium]|nr:V-type ATP synthase subunit E [Parachlamydiaceae bacterium]